MSLIRTCLPRASMYDRKYPAKDMAKYFVKQDKLKTRAASIEFGTAILDKEMSTPCSKVLWVQQKH